MPLQSPGPSSPIPEHLSLTTWKDYYEWRCIPLYSPIALLLHWPLTIYRAIQLATLESVLPEISNELRIHYLGILSFVVAFKVKFVLQLLLFFFIEFLSVLLDRWNCNFMNHRNAYYNCALCNPCSQSIIFLVSLIYVDVSATNTNTQLGNNQCCFDLV